VRLQANSHEAIRRCVQFAHAPSRSTVVRAQLGVHFEISGWEADAVPDLARRAVGEGEGYAVELLAVLPVRHPNFHDLPMRGSQLEFHVYLAWNVGEER
jgi:hypothetical protein